MTLDPAELPDAASVSSSLQQMWALTEVMQSQRSSASVGRFDVSGSRSGPSASLLAWAWQSRPRLLSQVDGCYRPHFLSLT